MTKSLIEFDPAAPSTVIRFDAPLPSYFEGRNIINLNIAESDWGAWYNAKGEIVALAKKRELPEADLSRLRKNRQTKQLIQTVESSAEAAPNQWVINQAGRQAEIVVPSELHDLFRDIPVIRGRKVITAGQLEGLEIPAGKKILLSRSMTGKFMMNMVAVQVQVFKPRMVIIERYRLENYLGNYGMGKTLSSFYVHPKSKVSLSVKSWKTSSQSYEEASSILDSLTQSASDSFQTSFNSERSKSSQDTENSEYYAEVKGEAGFCGIGSVEAKAGARGSSSSTREEFSKDVRNTTSAHASESSAKREMQHNVSSVLQTEEGEEEVLVREIENLNAGHVLNFVVRELNQEYHSVLVLKDVRICFFLGVGMIRDEAPLYQLDEFLRKYIRNDGELIRKYRNFILKEYAYVKDFTGARKPILLIRNQSDDKAVSADLMTDIENFKPKEQYISISRELNGTGRKIGGGETGQEIRVEGIPVDVNTVTMKTDGVVCTALLDTALALDPYSISMQEEALNREKAVNEATRAETAKHTLAQTLIMNGSDAQVERFVRIYGPLTKPETENE